MDHIQAFPSKEIDYNATVENSQTMYYIQDRGMTLLDYFAGQLLTNHPLNSHKHSEIASYCYTVAEAMLEERKKRVT